MMFRFQWKKTEKNHCKLELQVRETSSEECKGVRMREGTAAMLQCGPGTLAVIQFGMVSDRFRGRLANRNHRTSRKTISLNILGCGGRRIAFFFF